jgi:serine/threonine protein phosphatase PrpC
MPSGEQELGKVAIEIVNETIYGKNVKDNVTVIIIALNRRVSTD